MTNLVSIFNLGKYYNLCNENRYKKVNKIQYYNTFIKQFKKLNVYYYNM